MTSALSRHTIRQELYNQIPGLGLAGVADSITTTTLVDTYIFADTTVGTNHYRGFYLYRPDLTGDDTVKKVSTINTSTGAATISGTNYTNTADLDYEMIGLMHPDELNAAIMRAMTRIYFDVQVPLSLLSDGDMDEDGVTHWTPTSLDTHTKVTTQGKVISGFRALHMADTVGSYSDSDIVQGWGGNSYFLAATVIVDAGTATLSLIDADSNTVLATVSSPGVEGTFNLYLQGEVGTTVDNIKVRLTVGASGDAYWNHVVLYRRSDLVVPAPSWLDEQFKFTKLRESMYGKVLAANVYDARSRSFKDWLQPSMFSLDPLHLDSQPYQVQLMRAMPEAELWIQAKRPYSDIEDLSTDTEETHAPAKQVYAMCKDEIAKILLKRYPNDSRWQVLKQEAQMEIEAEMQSRPALPNQPIKREHYGSI